MGIFDTMQAAVLIPVYDEPVDIVLRPLLSLARQVNIDRNQYEAVLVVNNSKSQALVKSPEFLQNQKTISFIKYLNGQGPTCPFKLSAGQKKSIAAIKKSKMNIGVLDLSSATSAHEHNNVGLARDLGGAEICKRFLSAPIGNNGIIAMTDCDCRFSENYISELIRTFHRGDVNAAAGRWLTEIDPSLNHQQLLEQALAIHIEAETDVKNYKAPRRRLALKFRRRHNFKSLFLITGPNMAVRAAAWLAAGGVPHLSSFEDIIFGFKLMGLPGDTVYNPNFWVAALVRVSERAGMASLGRRVKVMAESIDDFMKGRQSKVYIPDKKKMFKLFADIHSLVRRRGLNEKSLKQHLVKHGADMEGFDDAAILELVGVILHQPAAKNQQRHFKKIEELVLEKYYKYLPKRVFE